MRRAVGVPTLAETTRRVLIRSSCSRASPRTATLTPRRRCSCSARTAAPGSSTPNSRNRLGYLTPLNRNGGTSTVRLPPPVAGG